MKLEKNLLLFISFTGNTIYQLKRWEGNQLSGGKRQAYIRLGLLSQELGLRIKLKRGVVTSKHFVTIKNAQLV